MLCLPGNLNECTEASLVSSMIHVTTLPLIVLCLLAHAMPPRRLEKWMCRADSSCVTDNWCFQDHLLSKTNWIREFCPPGHLIDLLIDLHIYPFIHLSIWHWNHVMQAALLMPPLFSWGQDDQNEVQNYFSGHVKPLVSVSAPHDAYCIISGTTELLRSRQPKLGSKSVFGSLTPLASLLVSNAATGTGVNIM